MKVYHKYTLKKTPPGNCPCIKKLQITMSEITNGRGEKFFAPTCAHNLGRWGNGGLGEWDGALRANRRLRR